MTTTVTHSLNTKTACGHVPYSLQTKNRPSLLCLGVLTNTLFGIIIRQIFVKGSSMAPKPKYEIGQKVIMMPVKNPRLSPRDSDLARYTGQPGEVADYYWISLDRGTKVFYIYTVRVGTGYDEVVLHEDELEPYIA